MGRITLRKIVSAFILICFLLALPVYADTQSMPEAAQPAASVVDPLADQSAELTTGSDLDPAADQEEIYTEESVEEPFIDEEEIYTEEPVEEPFIDEEEIYIEEPVEEPTIKQEEIYSEAYGLRKDYMNDLIQQDAYSIRMDVYEGLSATVTPDNFWDKLSKAPDINQMDLCALGMELYGVDFRWMGLLIGTTSREGYINDPYLYYAWACAMLNDYRWYPADAVYWLMSGWGGVMCEACGAYYSEHAVVYGCSYHASFCNTSPEILKCIYLALMYRDERIFEVDGMITGRNYSRLIYSSPVYNCQVWSW